MLRRLTAVAFGSFAAAAVILTELGERGRYLMNKGLVVCVLFVCSNFLKEEKAMKEKIN